jgi:hypothetical protein
MADASIAVSAGLAAVIFSTRFFEIEPNLIYAILLLVVGLLGIIYGFVRWHQ